MYLLSEREKDEAYLAANPGESYIIYFPEGGNIKLDLKLYCKKFNGKWIQIENAEWGVAFNITGGDLIDITAPDNSGWFAVIIARE